MKWNRTGDPERMKWNRTGTGTDEMESDRDRDG